MAFRVTNDSRMLTVRTCFEVGWRQSGNIGYEWFKSVTRYLMELLYSADHVWSRSASERLGRLLRSQKVIIMGLQDLYK